MDATMYYLELMFNFLSMIQPQKLMNRTMLAEGLFLKNKDKKSQKKNSAVNLLELIQTIMIRIKKLAEYKHLLVSLKTDN